ncbi:MAG: tRNA lysidine(34) synthetase TilS [Clostridiales bacterium]|nr:tRNA lysidine(34) synthetase TilS [Clostridiales bacterium]
MTERVMKWIKTEALIAEGDCVIAGVSGGADSVCLLLLLLELQEKLQFNLCVVHVEHGIREQESREDAAFVETLCERYQIPCHTYAVDVPSYAKKKGLGLEEAARIKRYECYEKEIARFKGQFERIKVALAHHADDNAETLLFQMVRGSGIEGLAGMRAKRPFVSGAEIIRPLLNVQRQEIEAYLKETGQEYRTDSTNLDTDYSRNRIRHEILPELSKVNVKAVSHINQSARLLQQVADYLKEQTKAAEKECCRFEETFSDGEKTFAPENGSDGKKYPSYEKKCVRIEADSFLNYPELIQTELLHRLLGKISGSSKDIGAVHVEAVRKLFYKQVGRSINLPYGIEGKRIYEGVCLVNNRVGLDANVSQKEKSRKIEKAEEIYCLTQQEWCKLEAGETVTINLPDGQMFFRILNVSGEIGQIHKKKYTKWLNYDKIKGDLQVRRRREGDYLTVDLQGHRKKLKEYFVNEKIPREKRETMWLLTAEAHVIWVIGGRISACYKIDEETKRILEIQMVGGNYNEN